MFSILIYSKVAGTRSRALDQLWHSIEQTPDRIELDSQVQIGPLDLVISCAHLQDSNFYISHSSLNKILLNVIKILKSWKPLEIHFIGTPESNLRDDAIVVRFKSMDQLLLYKLSMPSIDQILR